MPISCRFFEQRYPKLDDVVVVTVRSIQEVGAYVQLLEYKNIEGLQYSHLCMYSTSTSTSTRVQRA